MKIEIIRQDNSDLKAHVRKSNQIVSCGLEYPYYTFEDKDYSDFIIQIFNMLEVRRIPAKYQITEQLEEINDIIFVERGTYMMGFQINKVDYYKRKFQEGSIINAFNVLYQCRSQYLIKATQDMECQWIRKTRFTSLLHQYPNYLRALKQNSLSYYNTAIHQPLQLQKRIVMDDLKKRKDLEYIIQPADIQRDIIFTCLRKDDQDIQERKEAMIYQEENQQELDHFEVNFEQLVFYRLKITQKSEQFVKKFMTEIFRSALKQYRGSRKKKAVIHRLLFEAKTLILPFSLMNQDKQLTRFTDENAMKEYHSFKELNRVLNQRNPYYAVKTQLLRKDRLKYPQSKSDHFLIEKVKMKKKFNKRMVLISADIVAAPDLNDSDGHLEKIRPAKNLVTSQISKVGLYYKNFGYDYDKWDEVMQMKFPQQDLPKKISDEFIDELYLDAKIKNNEPQFDYTAQFETIKYTGKWIDDNKSSLKQTFISVSQY